MIQGKFKLTIRIQKSSQAGDQDWECPITLENMNDPVSTVDGQARENTQTSIIIMCNNGRLPASGLGANAQRGMIA